MQYEQHSKILADVFQQLKPEIVLAGLACVLFLGGTFKISRALWAVVTLAGWRLAGVLLWTTAKPEISDPEMRNLVTYGSPLLFDSLTNLIRWIALGTGVVLTLLGWSEVPERHAADFFACLVLIVAGMGLTAGANDLVLMFVALELVSIPSYLFLYLGRQDKQAQEAAMKYFLLSIFSSALLLFGFSYLYGMCGTTNLSALLHTLNVPARPPQAPEVPVISLVALIMVVAGLGFRLTAVPFHFYAPGCYQGTSTAGAGMLAFVPKVVGFVALIRILGFVLPQGVAGRNRPGGNWSERARADPVLVPGRGLHVSGQRPGSVANQRQATAGLFQRGPLRLHADCPGVRSVLVPRRQRTRRCRGIDFLPRRLMVP